MKISYLVILVTIGTATLARAQEATSEEPFVKRHIEMRPTEKRSLNLKATERNPYAARAPQEEFNEEDDQNSEEMAISSKLRALNVSGSSRSARGLRLLLGDILIERGKILPPLILDQTQHLKVLEVDTEKIVLGWMDGESSELTGKTLRIIYDLEPSVGYVLQGQVNAPGVGQSLKPQMGVLKPRRKSQK